MKFSTDSRVAEQQMHAIIFYLTAFGYIDGDFDDSEKAFVRDYIGKLVEQRARDALGDDARRSTATRSRGGPRTSTKSSTRSTPRSRDSSPRASPTARTRKQFVFAKLKLRCFELFQQFDEDNRAACSRPSTS